ncbi:MAG: hypothetical protein AB1432_05685 [Bacteroidota bacterium]|jgi:hypothetical protein
MKKNISLIILVFSLISISGNLFAQENNPDGKRISFHITPFVLKGNYQTTIPRTNYPYYTQEIAVKIPPRICFNLLLKYPISNKITLSAFFEQTQWDHENILSNSQAQKTNYDFQRIGGTLSIYFGN